MIRGKSNILLRFFFRITLSFVIEERDQSNVFSVLFLFLMKGDTFRGIFALIRLIFVCLYLLIFFDYCEPIFNDVFLIFTLILYLKVYKVPIYLRLYIITSVLQFRFDRMPWYN